jgi:hypothetical protein
MAPLGKAPVDTDAQKTAGASAPPSVRGLASDELDNSTDVTSAWNEIGGYSFGATNDPEAGIR